MRDGRAKRRVVALGSAGVLVTTALMAGAVAAPGARDGGHPSADTYLLTGELDRSDVTCAPHATPKP
ncbi:hypothetical protein G3I30_25405 [Actinospica acidiphila]|nr:hypothetical protein [Actinospica acidiphila]